MVSETLSPLDEDEELASEKPSVLPPSDKKADSKLNLVLVEGSKKRVAKILFLHFSLYLSGLAIMSSAVCKTSLISSTEKSVIEIEYFK